jgi:hypothetical protein
MLTELILPNNPKNFFSKGGPKRPPFFIHDFSITMNLLFSKQLMYRGLL